MFNECSKASVLLFTVMSGVGDSVESVDHITRPAFA